MSRFLGLQILGVSIVDQSAQQKCGVLVADPPVYFLWMVLENSYYSLRAFSTSFYSTCKIHLLYYQFMFKLLYSDVN